MEEEAFTEMGVECPNCGHEFPIMVHSDRGSTVTICEGCSERLEVSVKDGEISDVRVAS
jgi:ribosomal protein S27E